MKVKAKKSEDEIRRSLLEPISKNMNNSRPWESIPATWCETSETRLFTKLLEHKPVGVSKHFHLMVLHDFMNNVYEDENVDFEELLTTQDLLKLRKRRESKDNVGTMVFKPKYRIRPTTEQIMDRLGQLYDLNIIESNEYTPEGFADGQQDFFLGDGEFGELMAKKDEENNAAPQRKKSKMVGTPDSFNSRSSTPATRNAH